MMKILSVDTSTMMGSIALIEDDRVISEFSLNLPDTHGQRLLPMIDQLLGSSHCPIEDIDGFTVALGPGSFTGLRIALSSVKGLAMASGKPVVGVSTLEALALNLQFSRYLVCPFLDARKGEVYTALFQFDQEGNLIKIIDEMVTPPEIILAEIKQTAVFLGDGAEIYRDLIRERLGKMALFAPMNLRYPRAVNVARLALPRLKRGEAMEIDSLIPTYLRRSEAELKFSPK
ncbi:MAG: tRNA (adenosine(37)-N6)-threonylcarbamoyltransferase complex dimerization subunit type 1 TsaB [Deltaproteobacteria bacterium]|nr:MAG: tRNA (adenosine(37)-N6)-threonylcarbamoyltransferase complex dimerization subunit type 1 TsaB [Deltaproteobacteria bacterium]